MDEGRDDGFSAESHSNPQAFEAPPDDTTASIIEEEPVVATAATGDEGQRTEDEGEVSRSAAGASGADEGVKPVKKAKGKSSPAERTSVLKHEIDVLTHSKHKTNGELEEARKALIAARAELADIEKKKTGGAAAPAAGAAVAAGDKKDDLEPQHPKYREFNTDEEYEAATAKWATDHAAWDRRRIDAMRDDITKGIEERFTTRDRSAAAATAEQRMVSVLNEVRAATPEWNERAATLKTIQSSWYDPDKHGEAAAPFLSDLTQSLMLQGRKEGAELLPWLGEDAERAQRLADLLPTREVRDAILHAPSVKPLLEYFATEEGAEQFETLKQMHPVRMMQAIGALSARLQPAPRGSGAAAHSITKAQPSARPPAGTPGARGTDAVASTGKAPAFDEWMAQEDERERKDKMRAAGLSA